MRIFGDSKNPGSVPRTSTAAAIVQLEWYRILHGLFKRVAAPSPPRPDPGEDHHAEPRTNVFECASRRYAANRGCHYPPPCQPVAPRIVGHRAADQATDRGRSAPRSRASAQPAATAGSRPLQRQRWSRLSVSEALVRDSRDQRGSSRTEPQISAGGSSTAVQRRGRWKAGSVLDAPARGGETHRRPTWRWTPIAPWRLGFR